MGKTPAQRTKEYRERNLEKERARCRKYNREHKEERTAYLREWRRKNLEKNREYDRKYYWDNVEKSRAKNRRSRARLKNTPKYIYTKYRNSAKKRGLDFTLTFEQFMKHWQKPCYYCGTPIKTIGLDRVNNKKGYSARNVLPCHYACNLAKQQMTQAAFIKLCKKVAKRHG